MAYIFRLASYLPLWLLHLLGAVVGWLAFLLSSGYRQRFKAHAAQAGYRFAHVAGAVAESGKMLSELPRIWLGKPVPYRVQGVAVLDAAHASGKGLILLTPHLGCFEVTGQAYATQAAKVGKRMTALYRPAKKQWVQGIMEQSRKNGGFDTAPTTLGGVRQLIKVLKAGDTTVLLPDQVPPYGMGVWSPFFGRDAYTMTLSVRLAQQTGANIVLMWGERLSWGRGYVVHFEPFDAGNHAGAELSPDLNTAVAQINAAMERLIRKAPQQYLWEYKRYKGPARD